MTIDARSAAACWALHLISCAGNESRVQYTLLYSIFLDYDDVTAACEVQLGLDGNTVGEKQLSTKGATPKRETNRDAFPVRRLFCTCKLQINDQWCAETNSRE